MRNSLYKLWIAKNEPYQDRFDGYRQEASTFAYRPKISLIIVTGNNNNQWLKYAIESIINQTYDNWELCLVVGSDQPDVKKTAELYARRDSRIKIKVLPQSQQTEANHNEVLEIATGDFIGILSGEDELAPLALYECIKLLNQQPRADMIYTDEDQITDGGRRLDPLFKPDWSPDMFLSYPYTGNLTLYRKKIVDKIGGFKTEYFRSQDYDLALHFIEKTKEIYHIPKILYHQRLVPKSAILRTDNSAAKKALADYLARNNIKGDVSDGLWPGSYRVRRQIVGNPLVSLIIPSKDKPGVFKTCLDSIFSLADYDNYEILVVDNNSQDLELLKYYHQIEKNPKVRILHYNQPFNFSALNNYAASQAKGDYLLFLNNDTKVISPGWLTAMLEHAQRKEVGAVGAKLLFPKGTIQHCGIILGLTPFEGNPVAGYAFYGQPSRRPGYMGRINIINNYSAVTAACMLIRQQVFKEIGGFDENLAIAYNDVDLCLKTRKKGYLIVYTPYAEFYHYESVTRGYDYTPENKQRFLKEIEYIRQKWGTTIDKGDPYYNENLTLDRSDFSLRVQNDGITSGLRNLVYKAVAYYRRHGLARTIKRICFEFKMRLTSHKTVETYPPQISQPSISKPTALKKVSFLIGLPNGESKRYRVYNVIEGLRRRGIACCAFFETNYKNLEPVMDSDLVIIFRAKMTDKVNTIINKLRASKIPLGFDVDDLVFDTKYVSYIDAFKHLPGALKKEYLNDVKGYRAVLEKCDFATCTTEFLADVIRQTGKSCFVIPNTINKEQYQFSQSILKEPRGRNDTIRIGYFSGTSTHDRDFIEAAEALKAALKKYRNIELHIVGSVKLSRELQKLDERVINKPLMPHLEMLRYLSKMNINIAPLEQGTPFNDCKSELKIFEAALVGVPTIASRTDSYSKCITDGKNGLLAGTREEWLEKLSLLIENEQLRQDVGLAAKKDFIGRFYIENVADDIIRIYEKITTR